MQDSSRLCPGRDYADQRRRFSSPAGGPLLRCHFSSAQDLACHPLSKDPWNRSRDRGRTGWWPSASVAQSWRSLLLTVGLAFSALRRAPSGPQSSPSCGLHARGAHLPVFMQGLHPPEGFAFVQSSGRSPLSPAPLIQHAPFIKKMPLCPFKKRCSWTSLVAQQ